MTVHLTSLLLTLCPAEPSVLPCASAALLNRKRGACLTYMLAFCCRLGLVRQTQVAALTPGRQVWMKAPPRNSVQERSMHTVGTEQACVRFGASFRSNCCSVGAYDIALETAGIQDYNIMQYTSVMPPESHEVTLNGKQVHGLWVAAGTAHCCAAAVQMSLML